jgi:16S rRNA (adenine1518-N6/adenine1519-N6)-dimethyltransferase
VIPARRRFGQHFLAADWAVRVVDAIAPAPDDVFLEIGPGRGAVTRPLAARCREIVAVEVDRDLAAQLRHSAPPNVTVLLADILEADLDGLIRSHAGGRGLRVAGNLPYNISSPILFRLLQSHRRTGALRDATVMLQREVVDRLAAQPCTRDYGVLTILMRVHADVTTLLRLPPGAFRPPPKVWSSVARLAFGPPKVDLPRPDRFEQVVKALFSQRRKTVLNAVRRLCPDPADAPRLLERSGIAPGRRPETLDLPELAALTQLLDDSGLRAVL